MVKPASGKWLNESRILESSTVYVQAYIYYYVENGYTIPDNLKKAYYKDGESRFVIAKEYITDAEFEGVCIGARKGKLTIKDPFGDWLKIFILTGGQRNDNFYKAFCNFEIEWGWDGLKDSKTHVGEDLQRLVGIIYQTNYDTDNVAGDTITINFFESGDDFLGTLVFDEPADTLLLNDDIEANKKINGKSLNDCTVSEILNHIWKNSQSIQRAIGQSKGSNGKPIIDVTFQPTFDKGRSGKYTTNKIRFGDRVVDKINELIALAEPDSDRVAAQKKATKDGKSLSYSYEILSSNILQDSIKEKEKKRMIVQKTIVYGWRDYSPESDKKNESTSLFSEACAGPIVYLKKYPYSNPEGTDNTTWLFGKTGLTDKSDSFKMYKYAVDVKIDLKNFDYVSSLGKGKVDQVLTKYSQEDFAIIQDTIAQLAKKNNAGNIDFSQFKSWGNPTIFDVTRDKTGSGWSKFWGNGESDEAVQKRKRLYEDFYKEITEKDQNYANESVNAQIKGILANNVFNANITIMGDPSFGTFYGPNQIYFFLDTSNLSGAVSDMDYLKWMMKKATHHLQEGRYTTAIELYSLPVETPQISGGRSPSG